jgi:hypothetical protein
MNLTLRVLEGKNSFPRDIASQTLEQKLSTGGRQIEKQIVNIQVIMQIFLLYYL